MKAVQISKPGGNFEVVERPVPQPGRGQVRIKVEACGICHSDTLVKEGLLPGLQYPRVPGTRSPDASMEWVLTSLCGSRGSVLVSAGTAGIASYASGAAAATSSIAKLKRSPRFTLTEATRNT